MKVGIVTIEFLPVWGGIGSYCLNLCSALSDKVELHVFTPSRRVRGARFMLKEKPRSANFEVHIISSTSDAASSTLKYQIVLARKLFGLVAHNHFDLIHSVSPLADQLVRVLGISNSIPYVLSYPSTLWGQRQGIASSRADFKDMDHTERITLLFYPLLRLYESMSLRKTKIITVPSESVRDELVMRYGYKGNIIVIPNGVDTSLFQPRKAGGLRKSNAARVLFSGRFIALKGLQNIIRAIPEVLRDYPDVAFAFAGAGSREPYLRMLNEMKIPRRNFESYYVNHYDMPHFYNSGDMLVHPSLCDSFPYAVLEAMACGLPVIASSVGGIPKLVRDGKTGFLVEKANYQELALRIKQLLCDESLRQRMGKNSRKLVEDNYSLEVMGKKTLEVYQQVLQG